MEKRVRGECGGKIADCGDLANLSAQSKQVCFALEQQDTAATLTVTSDKQMHSHTQSLKAQLVL